MDCTSTLIPYHKTAAFSSIVLDYIDGSPKLADFAGFPPTAAGLQKAILARQKFPTNRQLLVDELKKQYSGVPTISTVEQNIEALLSPDTFTITTAHQPNIFTGPLYFIYKILHVIKIADELNKQLTDYNFVPAYYMGSEDADLEELGTITIDGIEYNWQTKQTGAVGRMKVDKPLLSLIDKMQGQLGVLPFGNEIIQLFKKVYTIGKTIQQATLELVNDLFGEYGLIVIIADSAKLKKLFQPVIEKELRERFSNKAVTATIAELEKYYKPQAEGRELNLFYLIEDKRERIELEGLKFKVESLKFEWDEKEILNELNEHPERFSPNVILRGALQETIL